jgi:hypothetical protein
MPTDVSKGLYSLLHRISNDYGYFWLWEAFFEIKIFVN